MTTATTANQDTDRYAATYATTGDLAARSALAETVQPIIRGMVRTFCRSRPSADPDAMLSAANFGLLDAIERFDPNRGCQFITVAKYRIVGAMLDEVRSGAPCPRHIAKARKQADAATELFYTEHGRKPTEAELADLIGEYASSHAPLANRHVRSLHLAKDKTELGQFDDGRDLFDGITKGIRRSERFILRLYFLKGLSGAQCAKAAGYTESRVNQVVTAWRPLLSARCRQEAA